MKERIPYLDFIKVLLGRYGIGCELSSPYFLDSATYCKAAEDQIEMPSLFDLEPLEAAV